MHSQDNQQDDKQHFEITVQIAAVSALDHLYTYLQNQPTIETISKQQLKKFALRGAVWLTQNAENSTRSTKPERLRRLKRVLKTGDKIDFYFNAELLNSEPTAPILIADFDHYSVWLKPRGMLSQGSKWADHSALYRWVEMNYKPNDQTRQSWIVHRLDRATRGLMLLAHTKKMAAKLSQTFEQGGVNKVYQANVWGEFPEHMQTIDLPVADKAAISHVSRLAFYPELGISRVEVNIETGRKHQIRSHLSQTGFPILGDRLYGSETLDSQIQPRPDLQLTAFKLSFLCPISQTQQQFELTEQQLDLLSF
ncbi:MAG: tRNA pseudouridine32 synthase/23S rRNA pseudouridine746 synthase [Thiomicrorhabdus sp.]|nr:MAG: tRNA pseudouridine32 synthase/23S rRNA pseudouridine746 synthase [Thiomicrorhabdus sp.]